MPGTEKSRPAHPAIRSTSRRGDSVAGSRRCVPGGAGRRVEAGRGPPMGPQPLNNSKNAARGDFDATRKISQVWLSFTSASGCGNPNPTRMVAFTATRSEVK